MKFFNRDKYPKHLLEDNLPIGKQIAIFVWEIFKVVIISLAIIIPVRYYLIKPFYVIGASMEPNFYDHQYLIIDELSYRLRDPERGQIVVFKDPFNSKEFFIKRLIGLPKETVKISDGDVYIINADHLEGIKLQEDYLPAGTQSRGEIETTLGPDEYFVMGDNRNASLDSRAFGPIKRDSITGRVFWRGWPLDKISLFTDKVNYNF